MKLLPGLFQVGGPGRSHAFDAAAYLFTAGNTLYMIDCGTPEGYPRILENIRSLGFDTSNIRAVFATHGHYDHCGAALMFRKDYGTKLFVHPLDRIQVETGDSVRTSAALLYGTRSEPTPVDGDLDEGFFLETDAGTLGLIHTPGHTPGSCCFVLEHRIGMRLLIAGDTLHGGFSEKIGSDEAAWRRSLDKLCGMHFDWFTFGHCPPSLLADADERIRSLRRAFGNYSMPWFKDFYRDYPY